MTICVNAINNNGDISVLADCRLTYTEYDNSESYHDFILKTYPIDDTSTISFSANDVFCVQHIIKSINPEYVKSITSDDSLFLKEVSKQFIDHYNDYYQKSNTIPKEVYFLLASNKSNPIIAVSKSPSFHCELLSTLNSCLFVGDVDPSKNDLKVTLDTVLSNSKGNPSIQFDYLYMMLKREIEDLSTKGTKTIGALFTQFRIIKNIGVRVSTCKIDQYMGSLSERNDGKGYARVNEVEFDDKSSIFHIHDYQNGKFNKLWDIYDFKPVRRGKIKTDFSHTELKKV